PAPRTAASPTRPRQEPPPVTRHPSASQPGPSSTTMLTLVAVLLLVLIGVLVLVIRARRALQPRPASSGAGSEAATAPRQLTTAVATADAVPDVHRQVPDFCDYSAPQSTA